MHCSIAFFIGYLLHRPFTWINYYVHNEVDDLSWNWLIINNSTNQSFLGPNFMEFYAFGLYVLLGKIMDIK